MKDRIEHTEHKRRDREASNVSVGERRYGRTAAPVSNGNGRSGAAASSAGEAEAWTEADS